ncbi:hypothetical protein, partial [Streptomyces tricolor]
MSPLELAADIVNQAARDHLAEVAEDFVRQASGQASPGAAAGASVAVRLRTAESAALAAGGPPGAVTTSPTPLAVSRR